MMQRFEHCEVHVRYGWFAVDADDFALVVRDERLGLFVVERESFHDGRWCVVAALPQGKAVGIAKPWFFRWVVLGVVVVAFRAFPAAADTLHRRLVADGQRDDVRYLDVVIEEFGLRYVSWEAIEYRAVRRSLEFAQYHLVREFVRDEFSVVHVGLHHLAELAARRDLFAQFLAHADVAVVEFMREHLCLCAFARCLWSEDYDVLCHALSGRASL